LFEGRDGIARRFIVVRDQSGSGACVGILAVRAAEEHLHQCAERVAHGELRQLTVLVDESRLGAAEFLIDLRCWTAVVKIDSEWCDHHEIAARGEVLQDVPIRVLWARRHEYTTQKMHESTRCDTL
tara:strand:- start:147 stop:524 length:378 start_codon:yes stop_codon:yes gene_type:complete